MSNRNILLLHCLAIFSGLTFIFYIGGATLLLTPNSDPLLQIRATTLDIWDTEPIGRHAFLAFMSTGDFARQTPYISFSLTTLLLSYFPLKILSIFDIGYLAGVKFLIFIPLLSLFLLGSRFLQRHNPVKSWKDALTHILCILLLVTTSDLWFSLAWYCVEDPTVWLTSIFFAFLALNLEDLRNSPEKLFWAFLIAGAVAPRFAPLFGVTWLLVVNTSIGRTQLLRSAAILIMGGISIAQPIFFAKLSGMSDVVGSTFLFRSGLDGDQRYFHSFFQAIFNPFRGDVNRVGDPFLIWYFLLTISIVGKIYGRNLSSVRGVVMTAALPLLYSLLLFPQHLSVHPYIYDFAVALPATLGLFTFTSESLTKVENNDRSAHLAFIFLLLSAVMSQLILLSRPLRILIEQR